MCKTESWEGAAGQRGAQLTICDDLEGWGGWGGGWREAQEEGAICIHIADPLHCTAESNIP